MQMKVIRSLTLLSGLILVWLIIQLFSHEYVSEKINLENQIKRQQITQGTNQFSIENMSLNQVVSSFQPDWVNRVEGIVSVKPNPEVSIELNNFLIVPKWHQAIVIDVAVESISDSTQATAAVVIELSNHQEKIYYHSADLAIDALRQPLKLNQIQWQVINNEKSQAVQNFQKWEQFPSFDGLVLRFYDTEMAHLKKILIPQFKPQKIEEGLLSTCNYNELKCFNNNHKNHMEKQANHAKGVSLHDYEKISSVTPMMWLVLSALLMITLLLVIQVNSLKVYGFVLILFISIGVIHQPFLINHADWLKWLLIPAILVLVWMNRRVLFEPQKMAFSIYLFSLSLAILLIFITQMIPDFALQLPGYFVWALIQQMLLGPVLSDLIKDQSNANNMEVALIVGVMFSVAHAPNHTLMLATLLGGVFWSLSWLKYKNIYANAFSHALLALTFYQVMPAAWLGSARIGVFF